MSAAAAKKPSTHPAYLDMVKVSRRWGWQDWLRQFQRSTARRTGRLACLEDAEVIETSLDIIADHFSPLPPIPHSPIDISIPSVLACRLQNPLLRHMT